MRLSVAAKEGRLAREQNRFPSSDAMHVARAALRSHWRLYVDEGVELAIFMISACFFTVWLYDPASSLPHLVPSSALRRLWMGISMGGTAILIIRSPMGKRSGAHFNPAITLTYFRLGKIDKWDAGFYVLSQFVGAICGVGFSALCLRGSLAVRSVDYVVTVPGWGGVKAAFCVEYFMAALLMLVVLWFSNRPPLAPYTSYLVGTLITLYVFFFAPVSGFSINPARTIGSAVFAHVWTAVWLYFVAPLLGMMTAAEIHLRVYGKESILCAKLHPDPNYPCPFLCHFPLHRHPLRDGLPIKAELPSSPSERNQAKVDG
jgi:aquaporin Z